MNTNELKASMTRRGITGFELADKIGLSHASFSYKLNNKREFLVSEIQAIAKTLNLSVEEIKSIFFTN